MADVYRQLTSLGRKWLGQAGAVSMPYGEIADRLSIAVLKLGRSQPSDAALGYQLHDVAQFSDNLLQMLDGLDAESRAKALAAYRQLSDANASLWDAENAVRRLRKEKSEIDPAVVKLACSIATLNETRASHKYTINALCGQASDTKTYEKVENEKPAGPVA